MTSGPPPAQGFVNTFKTAAAHILLNRHGAALQSGPRRYTRSWIRDGATMAAALLRIGCANEVRDFIQWYAQYQAEDGNIPCCVDQSGADWLPEYDSQGEFIYTVMEHFRLTRDRAFLESMWPAVSKAVDYLDMLRQRLTPAYDTPEKRACYGLLPESASHEGYLAHPVHAYWGDFWALRGLKDAAAMAEILGDPTQVRRIAALRDAFRETLQASLRLTMRTRHNRLHSRVRGVGRFRSDRHRRGHHAGRRTAAAASGRPRSHLRNILAGLPGPAYR